MSLLEPSELRQLRLFTWFLLLINVCIVAVGVTLGGKLEDWESGWLAVAVIALLVDGAFALIVGTNVTVVVVRRWRERRSKRQ